MNALRNVRIMANTSANSGAGLYATSTFELELSNALFGANLSTGGTAVDVTDVIHPDNRASQRVSEKIGLVRQADGFHYGQTAAVFSLSRAS